MVKWIREFEVGALYEKLGLPWDKLGFPWDKLRVSSGRSFVEVILATCVEEEHWCQCIGPRPYFRV